MMSAAGIICEYNPFHEGHRYHIQQVREKTGADTIVALMNGDFVQRGEPAIVDKYIRTKMALEGGADLVFELPVRYGLSSAEDFARGGIAALDALSFVDYYCFGSEGADQSLLEQMGHDLAEEPSEYKERIRDELRKGLSFPAARERAYGAYRGLNELQRKELFLPNNTLGTEYIKAAVQMGSHMKPVVIQREGMGYNECVGGNGDSSGFLSATAVRSRLFEGKFEGLAPAAAERLKEAPCFLQPEDFWQMCSYAIRQNWEEMENVKDMSDDLANSFRKNWYKAVSFEDFANRCKTRNITMARVKRCIFQNLLGIWKETGESAAFPYIRLLGMRERASDYLKKIEKTQLIVRVARDMEELGTSVRSRVLQDIKAADLYRTVEMATGGVELPGEFNRHVIVVRE